MAVTTTTIIIIMVIMTVVVPAAATAATPTPPRKFLVPARPRPAHAPRQRRRNPRGNGFKGAWFDDEHYFDFFPRTVVEKRRFTD